MDSDLLQDLLGFLPEKLDLFPDSEKGVDHMRIYGKFEHSFDGWQDTIRIIGRNHLEQISTRIPGIIMVVDGEYKQINRGDPLYEKYFRHIENTILYLKASGTLTIECDSLRCFRK